MANIWFIASVLALVGLIAAALEILTSWWWPWGVLIPGLFFALIAHLNFTSWLRSGGWGALSAVIVWLLAGAVIYFRLVQLILSHSSS